jgi:hypothetical protein
LIWSLSNRADQYSRLIADRHYNRQKIGTDQFVPPGRCVVLYAKTPNGQALWVTSWPKYARHEWQGAWICTLFRNEGAGKASELILDAVACTRHVFGNPPEIGMVTFIDKNKVKPTKVRGKNTWGRTYELAGFRVCGETKINKLIALQMLPADMPAPQRPLSAFAAFRIAKAM